MNLPTRRSDTLLWGGIILVALLAAALRYGLVEPPTAAQACTVATPPAWCGLRDWVVRGFLSDGFGFAALVATALALAWRRAVTAWLAAALGFFALELYCYQAGALALLIGCLLLLRHGRTGAGMPTPGTQDRRGDQQVEPQP